MKSERPELVSFGRRGKGNNSRERWTKGPSSIFFILERSKANMANMITSRKGREKNKQRDKTEKDGG